MAFSATQLIRIRDAFTDKTAANEIVAALSVPAAISARTQKIIIDSLASRKYGNEFIAALASGAVVSDKCAKRLCICVASKVVANLMLQTMNAANPQVTL